MIRWSQKTNFGSRGHANQVLVLANLLQLSNLVRFVFVFYVFFVFEISLYVFVPPFFPPQKKVESNKCGLWGLKELAELVEKPCQVHNVIIPDTLLQTDGDTLSSFVYLTCWCFGRIFTPCSSKHHLECLKGETLANSLRYSIVNIHASTSIFYLQIFADFFITMFHASSPPFWKKPHTSSTWGFSRARSNDGRRPLHRLITQWKWSTFQKSLVISWLFVGWHMPRCSMYVIFTYVYHKFRPYLGKYASPIEHLGWLFHVFCLHLRLVILMCLTHFLFFLRGTSYTTARCFFCFLCLFVVLCCFVVFLLPFVLLGKDKFYGKKLRVFWDPRSSSKSRATSWQV